MGARRRDTSTDREWRSALSWTDERTFTIGPVTYECRPVAEYFASEADRFCIRKPRELIERYERLIAELAPRNVFEVGMYECGSTALLAQLAKPHRLIAVDLEAGPNPAFERFVDRQRVGEGVRVHWGVDQADGERLTEICDADLGNEQLDLVIDDASHLLEQSRRTFEALFPRLRPGGVYVLEDWAWAHAMLAWPDRQPLTIMVAELVMASGHRPGTVAGLEISRPWAVIIRGPDTIDPTSFSIAEICGRRGQDLVEGMESRGLLERSSRPRRRMFGR